MSISYLNLPSRPSAIPTPSEPPQVAEYCSFVEKITLGDARDVSLFVSKYHKTVNVTLGPLVEHKISATSRRLHADYTLPPTFCPVDSIIQRCFVNVNGVNHRDSVIELTPDGRIMIRLDLEGKSYVPEGSICNVSASSVTFTLP